MRSRVLVAIGFAACYLYAFPYFERMKSANERPRLLLTEEIAERATVALDARVRELSEGSMFDVSTTCGDPPAPVACRPSPRGRACRCPAPQHRYSNKAPGVSILAVPAYAVAHAVSSERPSERVATWLARVSAVTLPALLFLPLLVGLAGRFAPSPVPRHGALVAYALGSMALPYALLFFSHALAAACLGGAFALAVRVTREDAGPLAAAGAGFLAGMSVLCDYQAALGAAVVGVYLLVRARHRVRDGALAALAAIPPALVLALYHRAAFGSPFATGYSFAEDAAHQQGFLGIVGPNREAMGQALLAPGNGLVVLMPWVLLALVGGWHVARDREARARVGAEALACGAICLAYVLFIGSLVPEFGRAGWSVGPRYITVALPFFAWLAAAGLEALDRNPIARTAAHALVLTGVGVYVIAATTYPHWPTAFSNPLYEVSLRALGAGMAPHSLGTLVGLRGLASLLPLYVGVAGLVLALLAGRDRRRWATTLVAAGLAVLIVTSYGWFPRKATASKWRYVQETWEPR